MIAARDLKDAASVGVGALLDVFDPGAIHAERHVVLGFAGYRAGMTANALAVIDDKSVLHRVGLPSRRAGTRVSHQQWVGSTGWRAKCSAPLEMSLLIS